jgi:hypothetical protein
MLSMINVVAEKVRLRLYSLTRDVTSYIDDLRNRSITSSAIGLPTAGGGRVRNWIRVKVRGIQYVLQGACVPRAGLDLSVAPVAAVVTAR